MVSGLILAGILGIIGLGISVIGDLSLREILLYVAAPIFLIALLVSVFIAVRATSRVLRDWSSWQEGISSYVLDLTAEVRRLRLEDVIHSAHVEDWTVVDHEDNLVFISPDEDTVVVSRTDPDPEEVAEELHNTAPAHFPEEWSPYLPRIGSSAAIAEVGVASLEARLEAHYEELSQKIAAAAYQPVLQAAEKAGWTIEWTDTNIEFQKTNDIVKVRFDNPDPDRLRILLGLDGA